MRKSFWLPAILSILLLSAGCQSPSSGTPAAPLDNIDPALVQNAAFIVAASNARANEIARADYVCSGDGRDEAKIQQAIDALPVDGSRTILLIGDFTAGSPTGISVPSRTALVLKGTITLGDNLNADACIFTNSDPVNGNKGISIIDGTLRGNEKNNARGRQYAVKFTNVKDSKVDCRIEDFRTADELMVDCEVDFTNRNYTDACTPQIKYLSRGETTTDSAPDPNISLNNKDSFEGQSSLQIDSPADRSILFTTSTAFDLRFTPLITLKYKVILGTTNHFWAYLYNPRLDLDIPLNMYKYNDFNQNKWKLALLDLSAVDWDSLNVTSSDFLREARFRLRIDGKEEGAPVRILVDDIYAVRGLNRAIVTQVFDDGYATDYAQAAYMRKYGYNGVSAIISTGVGQKGYLSLKQIQDLYNSGWDICNHSYSHIQKILSDGEQWIQDTAGRAYLEAQGFSRSAKYRLQVGDQSELDETDSRKISAARRYMGTNDAAGSSACLPYGYTQQVLNYFAFDVVSEGAEKEVAAAKKYHTWQIVAAHEVTETPGPYKTSPAVFQGFIDYLHASGMVVKNFSEVYAQYPLEQEPQIDFSVKEYQVQFNNLRDADPGYLCSGQDIKGDLPITVNLERQPDVPRTLTWSFASHFNTTSFTLVITGKDAKGITQTIKITEKDGWSGETLRDLSEVSIQLIERTGNGSGDSLQIGVGSSVGLPGKIFTDKDVLEVTRNGQNLPAKSYQVDAYYDTVDLSAREDLVDEDDYEIRYRSNLDRFAP